MAVQIDRADANILLRVLTNAPIAPGKYAHFINVGTDGIIDALDRNYFQGELADGLGCFKYLEGDYGSGKSQFIHSLAKRASEQDVATAIVTVGFECPFSSPMAIFRAIMESIQPPLQEQLAGNDEKGVEILIRAWIERKIKEQGAEPGHNVPEIIQRQIEQQIGGLWPGAPDPQMARALLVIGKSLLNQACGASEAIIDYEILSWVRGDKIRSPALRNEGLSEPVQDANAFRRLKTVFAFLRSRMGFKGFLIAFDEGTRTSSFRRGSIAQRQAIENMLSMINQNAEGDFGGVLFLYAATPDFRSEVISNYRALRDRIGSVAFLPGSPMVPLIDIGAAHSRDVILAIGERLLDIFSRAHSKEWDKALQQANLEKIVVAQEKVMFETPSPRYFVYQYCRFLTEQLKTEQMINTKQAIDFVNSHEPTSSDSMND